MSNKELEILQSRLLPTEFEYLDKLLALHQSQEGKIQLKEITDTFKASRPKDIELRSLLNDILRLDKATIEEKIDAAKKFNTLVETIEEVEKRDREIDQKFQAGINFWFLGIGGGTIISCFFPPLFIVIAGALLWKLMPKRN